MPTSAATAELGTWTYDDARNANHEAAHAVVAHFLNLAIAELRIDRPNAGMAGYIRLDDRRHDVATMKHRIVAWMAGPIFDGNEIAWPPRAGGPESDESGCAVFAECCARQGVKIDADEWARLTAFCREIFAYLPVRRALPAVSAALLARGVLSGVEVKRIVDECASR